MSENGKQVAVVTGATSGIGLACAKLLGGQGMSVYICGRDQKRLDEALQELRDAGADVDGTTCDVKSPEDIKTFMQAAVDRYGRVDVLVNNAGRGGGAPLATHPDELWFDIIDTNLHSVYYMTKEALNAGGMLERKSGHIINIASTSGKQGIATGTAYSASKHAVVGFTKSLGFELARQGILVNAVCPGFVETAMTKDQSEEIRAHYIEMTPAGRYGTPEEVAAVIGEATKFIARENIVAGTNCGMAPMRWDIAYAKLAALGRGAELAREQFA
jgi:ketoreductase